MLQPGMRIRICTELKGNELYGAYDPEAYKKWCGQEVTVKRVSKPDHWMVDIEEGDACFFMEEIECIVDDVEISESDTPIDALLGVRYERC